MRRKRGRGRWRRLRAGLVTPPPGGPGQPSGPTTRVCLQWLDVAGGEGRREPPGWKGPPAFPVARPEARPTGTEIAAMERRTATRFRQSARRRKADEPMVAPLGAPSPRLIPGGDEEGPANGARLTAYPAPQIIRALALARTSS